jgi:hypothetical protein
MEDLSLWNPSIGMWEFSDGPRQMWFVGKRLWHRPPNFAAFRLAKSSSVSVSTIESFRAGDYEVGIALQMLSLGRDRFLGLVRTDKPSTA